MMPEAGMATASLQKKERFEALALTSGEDIVALFFTQLLVGGSIA